MIICLQLLAFEIWYRI